MRKMASNNDLGVSGNLLYGLVGLAVVLSIVLLAIAVFYPIIQSVISIV